MKAGLYYADAISTVSPTYAAEIQTPAFGCGFDGLLRARNAVLHGILNGLDETVWDPWSDDAGRSPGSASGHLRGKAQVQGFPANPAVAWRKQADLHRCSASSAA